MPTVPGPGHHTSSFASMLWEHFSSKKTPTQQPGTSTYISSIWASVHSSRLTAPSAMKKLADSTGVAIFADLGGEWSIRGLCHLRSAQNELLYGAMQHTYSTSRLPQDAPGPKYVITRFHHQLKEFQSKSPNLRYCSTEIGFCQTWCLTCSKRSSWTSIHWIH